MKSKTFDLSSGTDGFFVKICYCDFSLMIRTVRTNKIMKNLNILWNVIEEFSKEFLYSC